jgi:hypothetical protein
MTDEALDTTPRSVYITSAYLKRLLIERHAIRGQLENPGGSVIVNAARKVEMDALMDYSTVIGNDYHLDLLDAEQVVNDLNPKERVRLLQWCDGLPVRVAAEYAGVRPSAIRMMRKRTIDKAVKELNDGGPTDPGGTG